MSVQKIGITSKKAKGKIEDLSWSVVRNAQNCMNCFNSFIKFSNKATGSVIANFALLNVSCDELRNEIRNIKYCGNIIYNSNAEIVKNTKFLEEENDIKYKQFKENKNKILGDVNKDITELANVLKCLNKMLECLEAYDNITI